MTKDNNPKGAYVYIAEIKMPNGKIVFYTGITKYLHYRVSQHIYTQKDKDNFKSFTSRGTFFRLVGAKYFDKPRIEEQRVKKLSPAKKEALARIWAKEHKLHNER